MKRRIFLGIFDIAFLAIIITVAIVIVIMNSVFINEVEKQLETEAKYIAAALNIEGERIEEGNLEEMEYLEKVGVESKNRLTLITRDGTVLFDNFFEASEMSNHRDREEIIRAIDNGIGKSARLSETLGEQTLYCAVLLDNGDVIRIAATVGSFFGAIGKTLPFLLILVIIMAFCTIIVARIFTNAIVNPLLNMNLEKPLTNKTYDELSPFLVKIDKQNKKIQSQVRELLAQRSEFDYVTHNMSEGLVIFGRNKSVISANKSAEFIFGKFNVSGMSYVELCREPVFAAAIEKVYSGSAATCRLTINDRELLFNFNPVNAVNADKANERIANSYSDNVESDSSDDESFFAVLFIMNVTEREQAEKVRREFSANVSHELKTPLTAILGYAEIMNSGIAKAEDFSRFSSEIYNEASRLLRLIEDIIKLSRLDETHDLSDVGDASKFEEIDLFEAAKQIVSQLRPKAEGKNISLNLNGNKTIISGISTAISEMIYNLVDNAINYNKDGGTVKISVSQSDNHSELCVSDNGIGIAETEQERIFERFYRVDKSRSKSGGIGGTGLGLSIVKHVVEIHHAKISLNSKLGEGTTITITF